MNRLRSRSIAATLLAAGLLLSACGQSDASGRIRNSSPEGECYETQEKKDSEVAFYQSQADEARRLGERLDELKKKQDDLGAAYTAMLPPEGETWQSLYAKIDKTSQAELDWDKMMEEVYQANLAAAAAASEYAAAKIEVRALPQYNNNLGQASEKPVCVTITQAPLPDNPDSQTATPEATPDLVPESAPEGQPNVTPEPSVPTTDNSVSQSAAPEPQIITPATPSDAECLTPPVLSAGSHYALRVGEDLVLEIPLCEQWGEDAGITIGSEATVNSRVEVSVKSMKGKNTAFIQFRGTQPATTVFNIRQSNLRAPYQQSEKTHFFITVVPVETQDPCKDTTPDVSIDSDGIITAKSECDAATRIDMKVFDAETKELKAHWWVNTENVFTSVSMKEFFGARKHVIESTHGILSVPVGSVNWYEFQLEDESTKQPDQPFDPLGIVELPPILNVDPENEPASESSSDTGGQTSDNNESANKDALAVSPAVVVVEPRTTSIRCDEACTDNVVKQSGIEPAKVQTVEASVNGSAWETVTPELLLPLAIATTTIQLRVTPKDGSKPVVLSTTVHKDAATINESTESQTLIVAGSGTQIVEVVPQDDSAGSTIFIVLIIALLAGLVIVVISVLPRIKRKSEIS